MSSRRANAGQEWLIWADAGNPFIRAVNNPRRDETRQRPHEERKSSWLAALIAAYRKDCPDAMLSAVI
jgi:hypothetical protein